MIVVLLTMITLLFILSLFEIRESYYLTKFQRLDTDQEGCLFKSLDSDSNGLVSANCRNKLISTVRRKRMAHTTRMVFIMYANTGN